MTRTDDARPHWAISLALVLSSFLFAMVLAWVTHIVGDAGRPEQGGPVELGEFEVLLHPAIAPALTPSRAMAEGTWRSAGLPFAAGWTRDTVWFRMAVQNTSTDPQSAWLEVAPSSLVNVQVHSRRPDGTWQTQVSGNGVTASNRPVAMAELVFGLELAAGERRTVLVETASLGGARTLGVAVHPAVAFPGRAERSNTVDLIFIGALVMLGTVCMMIGLSLRHLGLILLAARAFVGSLLQLQQFGVGALFLSASASAALAGHSDMLFGAANVLLVAFVWSFMSGAGLARWAHVVYGTLLASSVLFVALSSHLLYALLLMPFLGLTIALTIHLIFKGYVPAIALLVGSLSAIMINAPGLVGQTIDWVPRYLISPLPLLVTLPLLCLAAGLALRRERTQAQLLLQDAQTAAMQQLEHRVATRTRELQAARDEAADANQDKSVFLAKVSHELRTPMHVLLGYVDLALRQTLPATAQRQLRIARQAGYQLVSQINDLLDRARSERDMLKLMPTNIALEALALDLRDRMELLAQDSGNRFEVHCDPQLPAWVLADGPRLEQILMALLGNAFHHAPGARVTLRIKLSDSTGSGPTSDGSFGEAPVLVHFEVEDNGPGLDPELLTRIGQTFQRGRPASGGDFGLGLGMAITRQLLALMDSHLQIRSELGAGSNFSFILSVRSTTEPAAHPRLLEAIASGPTQGRKRQILVLEDNAAHRGYLVDLLTGSGFEVTAFGRLADALEHLRELSIASGPPPDLCIVDQHLSLPGARGDRQGSGWDFLRELLHGQRDGAEIVACPVLMLSATGAQPPEWWTVEHGRVRHLLKPVTPDVLLDTIAELTSLPTEKFVRAASRTTAPAATAGSVGSSMARGDDRSADHHAWQTLAQLAAEGSLSGLDDWITAHADLYDNNAGLRSLVEVLDFAGIETYAAGQRS